MAEVQVKRVGRQNWSKVCEVCIVATSLDRCQRLVLVVRALQLERESKICWKDSDKGWCDSWHCTLVLQRAATRSGVTKSGCPRAHSSTESMCQLVHAFQFPPHTASAGPMLSLSGPEAAQVWLATCSLTWQFEWKFVAGVEGPSGTSLQVWCSCSCYQTEVW